MQILSGSRVISYHFGSFGRHGAREAWGWLVSKRVVRGRRHENCSEAVGDGGRGRCRSRAVCPVLHSRHPDRRTPPSCERSPSFPWRCLSLRRASPPRPRRRLLRRSRRRRPLPLPRRFRCRRPPKRPTFKRRSTPPWQEHLLPFQHLLPCLFRRLSPPRHLRQPLSRLLRQR